MGRPSFAATEEQRRLVTTLAGLPLPHEQISAIVGVAPHTLRKHFRKELDRGIAEAHAAVMASLRKKAMGNDTRANIYLAERFRNARPTAAESFSPPQFVIQIEEPSQ